MIAAIPRECTAWAHHVDKHRSQLGCTTDTNILFAGLKFQLIHINSRARKLQLRSVLLGLLTIAVGLPAAWLYLRQSHKDHHDMRTAGQNHVKISRQLQWTSSVSGDAQALAVLNERMTWFYGQADGRELYQSMLDTQEDDVAPDSVRHLMPRYVVDSDAQHVLEVGCGSGRLYRQLRRYGYTGEYAGLEVADYVIKQNEKRHPETVWKAALAYDIPYPDASFDLCFSLYVLEHFVYPERALTEMLRVLKPKGQLVLVFPDFVATGRFPSQLFGFGQGKATEKLKQGRWLDFLVGLYDSRLRLPFHLSKAVIRPGPFPVNTAPVCLHYPDTMAADIDAVYIASKQEVHHWAVAQGCQVEYPCGTEGEFKSQAFLTLKKS